jgi:hypothetical protein
MQATNSNLETQYPTVHYRQQFTTAMVVAGAKVEKKDKEETPRELFQRIKGAKVLKENKSIKSATKKLLKKKKIKKLSCYFAKKRLK